MASLKDIRRKIVAVSKTKQITRAMNMVAASKLKAAQLRMENFRPYAMRFMDVLSSLALRVDAKPTPCSQSGTRRKSGLSSCTSDRGLVRRFQYQFDQGRGEICPGEGWRRQRGTVDAVGRKGRDYFRKKVNLVNDRSDVFGKFDIVLSRKNLR